MVGCAAVFPAASSVGVGRSPRVGVPSIPCVVSGGWWACAGVIRRASVRRVLGACAPGGRAASAGAGAALVPLSWYALPACGSWCPPWCPLSLTLGPRSCPFLALGRFPAPKLCRFRCPVPMGACLSLGALLCPLAGVSLSVPRPPLARALSLPGVVVVGGGGGAPMAQAWGWVAWSHCRRLWGV